MIRIVMRPHATSVTIVLTGMFQSDAFMPKALADARVISRKDATNASPRTLLPGAAIQFNFGWSELFVTQERFQIGTTEAPYVRVCDFVVKALREIESQPVINAFGINVESHFDLGTQKARDALGRRLAPPEAWGAWGKEVKQSMEETGPLHGGMVGLHMRRPFKEGAMAGFFDVVVGPSTKTDNAGVYFRSNHHHVRSDSPPLRKAGAKKANIEQDQFEVLQELGERFDASVQSAENVFKGVLEARS